jgi:hypothetical protein
VFLPDFGEPWWLASLDVAFGDEVCSLAFSVGLCGGAGEPGVRVLGVDKAGEFAVSIAEGIEASWFRGDRRSSCFLGEFPWFGEDLGERLLFWALFGVFGDLSFGVFGEDLGDFSLDVFGDTLDDLGEVAVTGWIGFMCNLGISLLGLSWAVEGTAVTSSLLDVLADHML